MLTVLHVLCSECSHLQLDIRATSKLSVSLSPTLPEEGSITCFRVNFTSPIEARIKSSI